MKFIVDAQLPQLLAIWLKNHGFDAIHTLELPEANRSDNQEITAIADKIELLFQKTVIFLMIIF